MLRFTAMVILEIFVLFLVGAAVGSFVNVVAMRHNTGLSPFKGSTKCLVCSHKLGVGEMLPLFSYLWQAGRCRYRSSKLSIQYLVAELVSGIVVALTCFLYGLTPYSLLLTLI